MDSNFEQYDNLKKALDLEKLEKRNLILENTRLNSLEIEKKQGTSTTEAVFQKENQEDENYSRIFGEKDEKKHENLLRKLSFNEEKLVEMKENSRKKEADFKEKEEKLVKITKERQEIQEKHEILHREFSREKQENDDLLKKIEFLSCENVNFSAKLKEINGKTDQIEENQRLKEKLRKYKEKLKEANEKLMVLLEEKINTKENSMKFTENRGGFIEGRGISVKELRDMRLLEENRVLRENAKRFSMKLLMNNNDNI